MRVPKSAHTSRPWRIHELTPDFQLEDVWALPTQGGPGELPRLVSTFFSSDFPKGAPLIVRVLWEARWKLGDLLGWDGTDTGARVPTLRHRLPVDLRDAPTGANVDTSPFVPLYQLEDEWAAELVNRTVHAIMHLGWVPDDSGGYRGQMAVLVKPNGVFGTAYMAFIKPFRYLLVYPVLIRRIEHAWRTDATLR